ncbi:hypothetical protein [Maribacter arcticus]|mgnify:CR=1 FL=1|uniref:Por secretion system C-terminal sorting domain-containing protein n=1 Tax=Maribacter arcticus TaxID=561365 RepID=A0A1T5C215_9FLAO|nr:hypothetical protein [Maribacter arcticus]SKB53638.1 hypothetical protein SAMN05660866_02037 [Maribacter arcticus]|tara:strand:+ start:697 stop:1284 length:588 start_codon:yes stop_codon:yes gene_type:complete
MKKFLKSTAALALLFATTTGMATEPKISLAHGNDAKSFIVKLDSQAQDSKIKLIDDNEQTIYSENILDANYTKKFNFKNLAIGTYYFSVENALSSVVYTLTINDKNVSIANTNESTNKPIFRKTDNKVFVNLFNADQQKVDITIIDSEEMVVFKESAKDELIIGKIFNFKKALKGTYTIRVNDGEDTYYQNITIG